MSLKNIIMFFGYVKMMIEYYLGLFIQKMGIKIENPIFMENKNWEVLREYYEENYDIEDILDAEYLGKDYRGYEVEDGKMLKRKENMSIEEKKKYNLADYKFTLPIHEELLSKLEIKINRDKYKFIYILIIKEDYKISKDNPFECYEFLENFFEEINFIFIYESTFRDNDKLNCSYEFLLNVNNKNINNILNTLNKIELLKKYKYIIKEVDDEINFFKGNYLLEQLEDIGIYKYINHLTHDFLVYKLNEDLEDFYILGNYISSINLMRYINLASLINPEIYINRNNTLEEIEKIKKLDEQNKVKLLKMIENKIEKQKNKIYKNIKNKYLKRTYKNYILLNINYKSRFRYIIKLFLNKIKKLINSNVTFSMVAIKKFNYDFLKYNNEIFKNRLNYDQIKIENQKFFNDYKCVIKNMELSLEENKKAFFKNNEFNWEAINSIKNYKNMLNYMSTSNGKNEESFNRFINENPVINDLLEYGEKYKLSNLNEINESGLFKEYQVEVWNKERLLTEIDISGDRIKEIDIQNTLKHLVLSIKDEDKIIIYPLTHSKFLHLDISILKKQILENKSLEINEEIYKEILKEIKEIKEIKVVDIELYKYKHFRKGEEIEEIQYRTGESFKCIKKNDVLIPERQKVLILNNNNEGIVSKYNNVHECLVSSHNLRMNVNKINEEAISSMYYNKVEYVYVFNPENNGLRKFSSVFNYLKEYFMF